MLRLIRLFAFLRLWHLDRQLGLKPGSCRACGRHIFSGIRVRASLCVDCQRTVDERRYSAYVASIHSPE